MEGKNDMAEQVWLSVRHQLRMLIADLTSEYTPKTKLILGNFMVTMKQEKIAQAQQVTWVKPSI